MSFRKPVLALLFIGLISSGPAVAQDSLDMTCIIHGQSMMTLKLSREDGGARNVEIIGGSDASKWVVRIDGADQTPATQTHAAPGQVKVHPGDTITWKVEASFHGVIFSSQQAAEAMLEFDLSQGQTLAPRTPAAAPDFRWGTQGAGGGTTLAVARVRESIVPDVNNLLPVIGTGDARRVGIFTGTSSSESFDEAYKNAVEAAQAALREPGSADEHFVFEVFRITGERGTIAGIRRLSVTIIAEVK